ncbi:MAG TPA: type II secretion system F family protein [Planctomycetota bacterium]|nr:type II secretion system F family protein [Planctomycetota bacterium]
MRYSSELTDEGGFSRRVIHEAKDRAEALASLGPARFAVRSLVALDAPSAPDLGAPARLARELSRLVALGIPLAPALESAARAHGSPDLERAAARAREGASLADALAATGGPLAAPAFLRLVEAGPAESALVAVASLASRLEATRRRLQGALSYPTIVVAISVLLGATVVTMLGEPARALASEIATHDRPVPAVLAIAREGASRPALVWGAALAAIALTVLLRVAVGRWVARAVAGRSGPGLGTIARRARAAIALRSLGALVERGVPLPDAWELVRGTFDLAVQEGVGVGEALHGAELITRAERLGLDATSKAGEGALGAELGALASDRERSVERSTARLALLLEPALEIAVGLGVLAAGLALIPCTGWLS